MLRGGLGTPGESESWVWQAVALFPASPPALSWQVNDMPFRNLTREEAVQFLLGLPAGEDMELVIQSKQDSECLRASRPAWQRSEVGQD